MRSCSDGLGAALRNSEALSSEWTSQIPCARKSRSKRPARNCGRPKRSRVKNRVIGQDEVFYHGRALCGKLLRWRNSDHGGSAPEGAGYGGDCAVRLQRTVVDTKCGPRG